MAAVPPTTGTVPSAVVMLSKNWTEPAAPAGATVAVSVTLSRLVAVPLAGLTASEVVVFTRLGWMVYGTAVEVDGSTLGPVGVNTAVSECDPTVRLLVDRVATPVLVLTGCGPPSGFAPSLNCTVPAEEAVGVTVAVSVTGRPASCEPAGDAASTVVVGMRMAGSVSW